MKIVLCVLILSLKLVYNNIWDNIFSQTYSPIVNIPDESKIDVNNEEKKIMEIFISASRNILKIRLIDEKMAAILINTSTVVDIYLNFTNGTINFDFSDNCSYKNLTVLKSLSVKFFLVSYDIFTFFNDIDDYYEYYVTNPLEIKNSSSKIRYQNNLSSKYVEEFKFLSDEKSNDIEFKHKGIINAESYLKFKVSKKTKNLEKIAIKINGYEFPEFITTTIKVEKFDDYEFQINHYCNYLNTTDEKN